MAQNSVNPNNNMKKRNEIMELWYKATGEKFGKVNLATNADFENAKLGGKKEYIQAVKDKEIPIIYENPINLRKGQNLHLVFYSNTHNYDQSNPKRGIETGKDKVEFAHDLNNKMGNDKTVVIFAGNIIGEEWKIGNLTNAQINKDGKILFNGIKDRVDAFIKDIIFAANNGADEIYLMNGREEHIVKQKNNVNIIKEAILDKFNELLFKYAIEIIKNDKENAELEEVREKIKRKNIKIAYVPGVKKAFNVVRKNSENKDKSFTFSVYTNTKSNSIDFQCFVKAVQKQHGGFIPTDAKFIPNSNVIGEDSLAKIYCVSAQSKYRTTPKGNVPMLAPTGRSSCTILFGEESHDIQVVFGNNMKFKNEDLYPAQRKLARKKVIAEFLIKQAQEKLEEQNNKLTNMFANVKFEKGE